jgi:divalent metal cation (Fe/Co/Zn/Cd) transporter
MAQNFTPFPCLAGLLLNTLFGLWWADSVAGLTMATIIAGEGYEALKGKACDSCCRDGEPN